MRRCVLESAERIAETPATLAKGRFQYTRDVSDEHGKAAAPDAGPRARWKVRRFLLGHEPGDDLSGSTTPDERLAMMWPLALEAWTLTGADVPVYDRRSAPVRKLHRGAA